MESSLSEMVGFPLELGPVVALLGEVCGYPKQCCQFVALALLLAKRQVACAWGRGRAPTLSQWLADLSYCNEQFEVHSETLLIAPRPRDIWAPLWGYLQARAAVAAETALATAEFEKAEIG